jgi:hypothetical protein
MPFIDTAILDIRNSQLQRAAVYSKVDSLMEMVL